MQNIRFKLYAYTPFFIKADGRGTGNIMVFFSGTFTPSVIKHSILMLAGMAYIQNVIAGIPPSNNNSEVINRVFSYLEQHKSDLGLSTPHEQLRLKNISTDKSEKTHLKFQQIYKTIPVWGREIIVHLDRQNVVYFISGKLLTGLNSLLTEPAVSKAKASKLIKEHNDWGKKNWRINDSQLYILNLNNKNYLVYRFTVLNKLLRNVVFMDAHSGEILHKISGIHTTD